MKPREAAEITYYINNIVKPGEYVFKVVSIDGVEAAIHVENRYLIGKSTIHKVAENNDENNKVISEDTYAVYVSWWSPYGSYLNITFNICENRR